MKTEFNQELIAQVRDLPHQPGVYIFKDRLGRIIYVGKAKDLHKRVSQYFHPSKRWTAELKTRALISSICSLETHCVNSEPEAILLEGKLIKDYRPKYNISFRDDKRFLMLKVNLEEPLPQFQLTRFKKEDGARYFGPFAHSSAVRNTLELVKKKFGLRSCKPTLPNEKDFKHCMDHIIKNCSAPCVAKISQQDYRQKVEQACEFLQGRTQEMMDELSVQMQKAAESLDFEKAAQLRNSIEDIRQTTFQSKRFVRQDPSKLISERDLVELQAVLNLSKKPEVIECFDISNISDTHKVASMVCFRYGKADSSSYRRYRIKSVQGQDDFASMAEVIKRRFTRLKIEQKNLPDLIVVDGGKGQISAAYEQLKHLGLESQALIGLAKQNEEIFFHDTPTPLVLPRESGALKLLQRLRDEAHRFANGYHQLLMKKRMRESILDNCEGISRSRKQALLEHFGSVERIRKATPEQLAEVKGISKKLASELYQFFKGTSGN